MAVRNKFIKRCLFFMVLMLAALTHLDAQNLNQRISIHLENVTIEEAITNIGNETGINFSYSTQSIPIHKKVSIKANRKKVKWILDRILLAEGIEYFVVENQIILKNKVKSKSEEKIEISNQKLTLSGYVKDLETGEVLIGAHIYLKGSSLGTITNAYGFYSISLRKGDYQLFYSYMGYEPITQSIQLTKNIRINKNLKLKRVLISSVQIEEKLYDTIIKLEKINGTKMSKLDLSAYPGFAGNQDLIKSLQAIPGIKSYGDGSSMFHVRGGNRDQNLILVDEAPLYNPSHLFGFFSAIAPDALNDAQIYKGDFPAKFGGRLASVIDVKIKEGNMKKFAGGGNVGLFTTWLTLDGPIKKDRSSMFMSLRGSNVLWLFNTGQSTVINDVRFTDLNLKFNYIASPQDRFYISLFGGRDSYFPSYKSNGFGIAWNNNISSFRWNHVYNDRLFSNTTFYISNYQYLLYLSKAENNYWKSGIVERTLKADYSWYLKPTHTIRFGGLFSSYLIQPGNLYFADQTAPNIPQTHPYNSAELTFYANDEYRISESFFINYGLRIPLWMNGTPAFTYDLDEFYRPINIDTISKGMTKPVFISPEPRLSLRYAFNPKNAVKLYYNRSTQFLQILSNSDSPFTSMEVWIPSGRNIKPQKSDLVGFSFTRKIGSGYLVFETDFYYKWLHNSLDYADHADLLLNPFIEGELRSGKGKAYGVEFLLSKKTGIIQASLSYIYSRSFRQIETINDNQWFPASYDSPHNVFMSLQLARRERLKWNINWMYLSGNAISSPSGFYYYNGYSVPIYEGRNNDRLPDYHRLDVTLTYQMSKPERKTKHSIIFSVYNLYGRWNPYSLNFNKMMEQNGQFVIPANHYLPVELVSTTRSVSGIVPSINYRFKF